MDAIGIVFISDVRVEREILSPEVDIILLTFDSDFLAVLTRNFLKEGCPFAFRFTVERECVIAAFLAPHPIFHFVVMVRLNIGRSGREGRFLTNHHALVIVANKGSVWAAARFFFV